VHVTVVQVDAVGRRSRRFKPGPYSRFAPPRPANVDRAFEARLLDAETVVMLAARRQRREEQVRVIGVKSSDRTFLFSHQAL
jgi:hypothetical protein